MSGASEAEAFGTESIVYMGNSPKLVFGRDETCKVSHKFEGEDAQPVYSEWKYYKDGVLLKETF